MGFQNQDIESSLVIEAIKFMTFDDDDDETVVILMWWSNFVAII